MFLNYIWYISWLMRRRSMLSAKIPLVFFATNTGNEPVRDWLKELPDPDRQAIGQDLMRAQWRWPVGMPLCRNLGKGLWEIRTTLASNRIARVIFCAHEGELVALHGFIKKTQKTSQNAMDLAAKRKKELDG